MKGSFTKLGYVGLLAGAVLVGSLLHVYGGTTPTVFQACLTPGGTLVQVSVSPGSSQCPSGTTPVTWNQQGPPGAAGGLTAISEITASTTFTVPSGTSRLMVEAWGGGGGGGSFNTTTCLAGGGGGGGGYLRTVIAVTPGESLAIVVGNGGTPGVAGTATVVMSGVTTIASAGGGAGGTTSGGAGGQVVSSTGLVRSGNLGGDGQADPMCLFGFGNGTILAPVGTGGPPVQGSVATLGSSSAGGSGSNTSSASQPGQPGEVILTW